MQPDKGLKLSARSLTIRVSVLPLHYYHIVGGYGAEMIPIQKQAYTATYLYWERENWPRPAIEHLCYATPFLCPWGICVWKCLLITDIRNCYIRFVVKLCNVGSGSQVGISDHTCSDYSLLHGNRILMRENCHISHHQWRFIKGSGIA